MKHLRPLTLTVGLPLNVSEAVKVIVTVDL